MEERAAEFGETFQALDDEPELPEHLSLYWQAFWDVHTDRPVGMGEGPIPFAAIDRYAARFGIDDPDHFDRFAALIRRMDNAFLRARAEKQPKG